MFLNTHNLLELLFHSYFISVLTIHGLWDINLFIFSFSEQVLGRVTNLRVTNANGRRIRIAWMGVAEATGYRVTWRQGSSKCYINLITFESRFSSPHHYSMPRTGVLL